ncbi:hypothetical protein [Maribacter sp. 2307ULW6-5]|uniref:hypothetical protein n=1 Tax=Maribacter sp. 2307ULW6-5 TaxID=3386275 RepID=UPI0039BD36CF
MKKNIKALVKEIVPIILGILIALYIDNWNQNRKDQKYVDQMIASMDKELEESLEDIKKTLPQQTTLIDSLAFYGKDEQVSIFDVMMKANGIHLPSIKTTSWKAISTSKLELMAYKRIRTMTQIQEQKENMLAKCRLLMDFTYQNIKETDSEKKELVGIMMQDIMVSERDLQAEIEAILED